MPPAPKPALWAVVVVLLATGLWFGRIRRDLPDFEVYRTAASRAMSADPLYRPEDGHWQYKYLPAFALAMAPFALLPGEVARLLWFTLSVALLVVFVRRSVAIIPDKRLTDRTLTWLAVLLVGRFYVHELDLGQTNILLGLVLISALAAMVRQQALLAGALVGTAVFVKPYALILLPWLPVAAGWQAFGAASVALAVGLMAPAVVYGWSGNLSLVADWYRTVTDTTVPNLLFPENVSLAALWAKWLGPSAAASMLASVSVAMLLLAAAWVIASRRRVTSPACLEFGLLLMLVPLVSPQGWDYVLLIATPGFLVLANTLPALPRGIRVVLWTALGIMAFTIFDLVGRSLYMRLMHLSVLTLVALVLAGGLGFARWRRLA